MVVVTIVIDQLAAWIASDRLPLLPADGGFARLRREGTYVREARYAHAATDTAPGHAALYTGAWPRLSGVVANERVDLASGMKVSFLRDPSTRVVALAGDSGAGPTVGSSASVLRAPTLADAFLDAHPGAYVVSLSLKDRASIPGGGQRPTTSLWFDPRREAFVSSTAFVSSETGFPPWARASAARSPVSRGAPVWTLLDPGWVREHATTPDDQVGEGALEGQVTSFPHDLSTAVNRGEAFRATPFSDAAVLELARAAIDAPGFGERPTLLALSLSSNDYVGHFYGPDSFEAWDNLRVLDRGLGDLFAALDARVGRGGWAAVLSADHGVGPLPETAGHARARPWCRPGFADRFERPCEGGGRVSPSAFTDRLREAARATLGPGDWVLGFSDPYVSLSDAARALPADARDRLVRALIDSTRTYPEIARAIDLRTMPAVCPDPRDESIDALVCRSVDPSFGDLYVFTRPGSFFDSEYTPGRGVNHGTPYLYDRTVPVLARAPGIVAAGRIVEAPQSFATFTRTAASLLGIHPPRACAPSLDLTLPAPPH